MSALSSGICHPGPNVPRKFDLPRGISRPDTSERQSGWVLGALRGPNRVLVQGSASGGETSLLVDPFDFRLSDISPSNSELLVIDRSNWATGDQQAWTVPLPSGSRRRLGNIQAHDATWSPDGKQIAFAKGSNILLADAYGTNLRQLISVEGNPSMMRFSPDGTRIRFSLDSPDDTANSIWEVRSDGKDLHPLLPGWHNPQQECCGIWTPDGRYYLFTSGNTANIQVMRCGNRAGYFVSLQRLTSSHRVQRASHLVFRLLTGRDF